MTIAQLYRTPLKLLALLTLLGSIPPLSAEESITIGSGDRTGLYYQAAGFICELLQLQPNPIPCQIESTAGSVYNLKQLRAGSFSLAFAQSDMQYQAVQGVGEFVSQGADSQLRAIFSLHPEAFTVVARADAGIQQLTDLIGKKVNIGNPGSGQRAVMEAVVRAMGWTLDDFALASELNATEQSKALCEGQIEAIVYAVGHPNPAITEATSHCKTVIVEVSGAPIEQLIQAQGYRHTTIPGGLYAGHPDPVKTFGFDATLVTSAAVSEEIIYRVVKRLMEQFEPFKQRHPSFIHLTKEQMIRGGNRAPLHPGAVKYYREVGLL